MKNSYRKVARRFKGVLIFYVAWVAIQLLLLILCEPGIGLWPFAGDISPIYNYGIFEFLFYIGVPPVALLLAVLLNRKLAYRLF